MPPGESPNGQWIHDAVERYQRPLLSYTARILGRGEHARDIVQDVFVRLCEQDRAAVEPQLAAWLFRVCRNRAIDEMRKAPGINRMTTLTNATATPTSDAPAPPEAMAQEESKSALLRQLESLPGSQQEAIRLKFQHNLSYKQIADITGHSVGNVGFLIHTGIKTLRQRLGDA
jgi:RNA polymerase sigma-70 factor (ECF subfamily)